MTERIASRMLHGNGEASQLVERAITDSYTPGEAAVQALQAGCDVLLMPDGLADAYDAVLAAVQNGTLSEDRLDLSVNKILRMKAQFCA